MPKFKYTAIDANGKQKSGSIEAGSQDVANSKLIASGLMPTKLVAAGRSSALKPPRPKEKHWRLW